MIDNYLIIAKTCFKRSLFFLALLTLTISCENDSPQVPKDSFIKFYGRKGFDKMVFADELQNGGYVFIGTSENEIVSGRRMYVAITDEYGIKKKEEYFGTSISTGKAFKKTTDGYVFLGEHINADNSTDLYIVKTNDILEKVWEKVIELPGSNEDAYAISILPSGNYFLLGTTSSGGLREACIAIIDGSGSTVMNPSKPGLKLLNNDLGKNVVVRENGRITWSGTSYRAVEGNDPGTSDVRLIFTTEEGVSDAGDFDFGRKGNDVASDIQKAPGGYVLLGTSEVSTTAGSKIFVVKTNETGGKQWEKVIGPERSENNTIANQKGASICTTKDGGYVIVGTSDHAVFQDQDGINIYLTKLNSFGEVEWEEIIGGKGNDEAASVRETLDGGFIIGATLTLNGDPAYCLIKTNSRGKLIN